jgi:hypothetical protein
MISAVAFWFSIKFISLYLKVKKWNRVKATIISKEIFLHPKVSSSRSPYGIKVNYTYQVDNSTYKGCKMYLVELAGGQTNHMKSTAESKLNKIEDTMSIYVNPKDSTQSVMYCEGIGLYLFMFFMGIISLLIGLSKVI